MNRSMNLMISPDELELRKTIEKAKGSNAYQRDHQRIVSNALKAYAHMVGPASQGAVRTRFA